MDATTAADRAGIGGRDGTLSVKSLLSWPAAELDRLRPAAATLAADGAAKALDAVRLGPPVPDPDKIICLGLNYRAHAEEFGAEVPSAPILFAKFRNSLAASGDPILLPNVSQQIDFEGELGVVIGRETRNVSSADALEYVAGYMPMNDVTARDLQFLTSQWMAGKALDSFAPCGPSLVTRDEVGDVQNLRVTTRVSGVVMQDDNTSRMIFPIAEAIAFISRLIPLVPGDIIATGTPEGVGFKRQPPRFLSAGDVVEVEIESIGRLINHVVAAPDRTELVVA